MRLTACFQAFLAMFLTLTGVASGSETAPSIYGKMMGDSHLDITIALGYSEKDGHNRSTPSPIPLIGPLINAINAGTEDVDSRKFDVTQISQVIAKCAECGFKFVKSAPGVQIYQATIFRGGRPVAVNLKFIHPDEGVSADTLKSWFRWGTLHDDLIIYAGHSRAGAGFPDFGPSSETSGKVFHKIGGQWGGFRGVFPTDKYQILFLNSCQSRRYYEEPLRHEIRDKEARDLGLILTNDNAYFEDYPATSMALIRGIMLQEPSAQIISEMEKAALVYKLSGTLAASAPLFYSSNVAYDIGAEKIIADSTEKSITVKPATALAQTNEGFKPAR